MSLFFSRLVSSLILAASFLIPFPVLGEQTPSDTEVLETTETKEIIVTASRYEEVLSSVPANASIITEKDIKNSTAKNIPDLLRNQPGILVNDITGNQRNYTVDLRGFGETAPLNTLVLIDGRRVNQPDLSGADWAQISLDQVQRIEIIRGGSGSVLYGDNASGGVVNIITKEGEKLKAGAGVSLGSYDTANGNAYVSGSLKDLSYAFSGSYLTSDGYRDNSETNAKDAGVNLGYAAGERFRLGVSAGYHKDKTGLPGALFEDELRASRTQTTNPNDFSKVEDYYAKIIPEFFFQGDSSFKIDMGYRKRDSFSFSTFFGGNFAGDTTIETNSISPQFLFKNRIKGIQNTATLGADYLKSDEDIANDLNSDFEPPSKKKFELQKENYGFYIHDELKMLDDLTVAAGYRYDHAYFSFQPSTPGDTSADEDAYTIGVNYQLAGKSYVYGSYSRSFRYPVLDEIYSFFDNTINTGLVPQRSDNYEIGARYYFADKIYVHLNLFRIDTDDEIFFNPTGGLLGFGANENLDGETRRKGIEFAANAGIFPWLGIGGSYTYTDATIRGGQNFDGKDIPNVPMHKASGVVEVTPVKGGVVILNGLYIGERPFISDFSNSFSNQDEYTLFNARFRYGWKFLTAFLDINNIFNKKHSEFGTIGLNPNSVPPFQPEQAFYPSPERNFLAGVTVDF